MRAITPQVPQNNTGFSPEECDSVNSQLSWATLLHNPAP
jgi:hypothetical protein